MKITEQDVAYVAGLARLSLTAEELKTMTGQMDAMLGYVDKLNELNTDGIVPTAHAVPMANAFRADQVVSSIGTAAALANAPHGADGCFQVPRVIE